MSNTSFEGKVALVTGATSGIGLATATAFAERGAKVVLAGRREDRGEEAAGALRDAGHEAFFVKTDITRPAEVKALVGATVDNASIAGMVGFGGMAVYSASKHAVVGLTRSAAVEYAAQGLRINAVAPGAVQTDMYDRFLPDPTARAQVAGLHPIGRTGTPEEIAAAVLWLSEPANTFTVGVVLPVDGGFTTQ